jgi:hypothetical protein
MRDHSWPSRRAKATDRSVNHSISSFSSRDAMSALLGSSPNARSIMAIN